MLPLSSGRGNGVSRRNRNHWYLSTKLSAVIAQHNPLTPNDRYMSRTAPLTSKRCILYIYSTNIGTEYFKNALYSPFFSLKNAVCFIMLTCLVPVLFTFFIQNVLKLKKNNSGAKGLTYFSNCFYVHFQKLYVLTLWRRNYFFNFSTFCI